MNRNNNNNSSSSRSRPNYIKAISLFCQDLGFMPIYSTRIIPGGTVSCCLSLPDSVTCPAINTSRGAKVLSMSSAAERACRILMQCGRMDRNLRIIRIPQQSRVYTVFGNYTMTKARQVELGLETVDLDLLCHVLSFHKTSEILSALGEAFLKFFFGAYYFARHQLDLKGPLTTRIQNELGRSVIASYLNSTGLTENICTSERTYSDKKANDAIRGVIGAAIVSRNPDNAIKVARSLGMSIDTEVETIGDIQAIYEFYCPACRTRSIVNPSGRSINDLDAMNIATKVQRRTGYSFADHDLLVQALSHQSSSIDGSNQRLELLGDAVLEFVVALHYYHKYPEMPTNDFKNFKSSILSNDALGSLFASLGLGAFLNTGLEDNIDNETKWKEDAKTVVRLRDSGMTDWKGLHLDKVLGDAMEALIGAIFVDSGFVFGPVQEVLNLTLYPFIDASTFKTSIIKKKRKLAEDDEETTNSKKKKE